MNELALESDYRDRDNLKQAFFEFTPQALYGAEFDRWDRLGFWNANYIPYSLVDYTRGQLNSRARVVANVSVSRMQVLLDDRPVRAIQFATVGTLPEFRGRGYADRLMRHALDREDYDLAFLFANESVVDFYPKFGFRRVRERLFYRAMADLRAAAKESKVTPVPRRLRLEASDDLASFKSLLARRAPISRLFGALDYEHILPFYAVYAYGESLHYFAMPDSDAGVLIVAENEGDVLNVYDVVCNETFLTREVVWPMLLALASPDTREICYYFTPDLLDPAGADREFDDSDSPLFVLGEFLNDPGRPFKFPALAQT